jgi:hypothetical protein
MDETGLEFDPAVRLYSPGFAYDDFKEHLNFENRCGCRTFTMELAEFERKWELWREEMRTYEFPFRYGVGDTEGRLSLEKTLGSLCFHLCAMNGRWPDSPTLSCIRSPRAVTKSLCSECSTVRRIVDHAIQRVRLRRRAFLNGAAPAAPRCMWYQRRARPNIADLAGFSLNYRATKWALCQVQQFGRFGRQSTRFNYFVPSSGRPPSSPSSYTTAQANRD